MKTALLVTGGDAPPFRAVQARLAEFSFVCAADSGLDTVRAWGVRPDLVVGDFDSISDPALLDEYPSAIRYPEDKDDTDTELGIRELRNRGYERIVLAGGSGGRLDHLLAIRALFERPDGPDEWLTSAERVVRVEQRSEFTARPGSTVSVFPLAGGSYGMSSEGLKWPLAGLEWNAGTFGVSNVATDGRFTVDPGHYPVLVVLEL